MPGRPFLCCQELDGLSRDLRQDVAEIVAGIEDFQANVGSSGGKRFGILHWHDVVVTPMEDQCGLRELWEIRVLSCVFEQAEAERAHASLRVVVDAEGVLAPPAVDFVVSEALDPTLVKSEGR